MTAKGAAELIGSRRLLPPKGRNLWVFGYGSLMWRPDFPFEAAAPALLRGYHRAFCIWSFHYRGSAERPGLVLGLDRGGACRGRAFRVAQQDAAAVCAYLHEREMITGVYEPRLLPVEVGGRRVLAAAYLADRRHPQYAGKLSTRRILRHVLAGHGSSGSNYDYLESTVAHLDELGIADGPLHRLLQAARRARRQGGEPPAI
jgi:cation transport protein ChaC